MQPSNLHTNYLTEAKKAVFAPSKEEATSSLSTEEVLEPADPCTSFEEAARTLFIQKGYIDPEDGRITDKMIEEFEKQIAEAKNQTLWQRAEEKSKEKLRNLFSKENSYTFISKAKKQIETKLTLSELFSCFSTAEYKEKIAQIELVGGARTQIQLPMIAVAAHLLGLSKKACQTLLGRYNRKAKDVDLCLALTPPSALIPQSEQRKIKQDTLQELESLLYKKLKEHSSDDSIEENHGMMIFLEFRHLLLNSKTTTEIATKEKPSDVDLTITFAPKSERCLSERDDHAIGLKDLIFHSADRPLWMERGVKKFLQSTTDLICGQTRVAEKRLFDAKLVWRCCLFTVSNIAFPLKSDQINMQQIATAKTASSNIAGCFANELADEKKASEWAALHHSDQRAALLLYYQALLVENDYIFAPSAERSAVVNKLLATPPLAIDLPYKEEATSWVAFLTLLSTLLCRVEVEITSQIRYEKRLHAGAERDFLLLQHQKDKEACLAWILPNNSEGLLLTYLKKLNNKEQTALFEALMKTIPWSSIRRWKNGCDPDRDQTVSCAYIQQPLNENLLDTILNLFSNSEGVHIASVVSSLMTPQDEAFKEPCVVQALWQGVVKSSGIIFEKKDDFFNRIEMVQLLAPLYKKNKAHIFNLVGSLLPTLASEEAKELIKSFFDESDFSELIFNYYTEKPSFENLTTFLSLLNQNKNRVFFENNLVKELPHKISKWFDKSSISIEQISTLDKSLSIFMAEKELFSFDQLFDLLIELPEKFVLSRKTAANIVKQADETTSLSLKQQLVLFMSLPQETAEELFLDLLRNQKRLWVDPKNHIDSLTDLLICPFKQQKQLQDEWRSFIQELLTLFILHPSFYIDEESFTPLLPLFESARKQLPTWPGGYLFSNKGSVDLPLYINLTNSIDQLPFSCFAGQKLLTLFEDSHFVDLEETNQCKIFSWLVSWSHDNEERKDKLKNLLFSEKKRKRLFSSFKPYRLFIEKFFVQVTNKTEADHAALQLEQGLSLVCNLLKLSDEIVTKKKNSSIEDLSHLIQLVLNADERVSFAQQLSIGLTLPITLVNQRREYAVYLSDRFIKEQQLCDKKKEGSSVDLIDDYLNLQTTTNRSNSFFCLLIETLWNKIRVEAPHADAISSLIQLLNIAASSTKKPWQSDEQQLLHDLFAKILFDSLFYKNKEVSRTLVPLIRWVEKARRQKMVSERCLIDLFFKAPIYGKIDEKSYEQLIAHSKNFTSEFGFDRILKKTLVPGVIDLERKNKFKLFNALLEIKSDSPKDDYLVTMHSIAMIHMPLEIYPLYLLVKKAWGRQQDPLSSRLLQTMDIITDLMMQGVKNSSINNHDINGLISIIKEISNHLFSNNDKNILDEKLPSNDIKVYRDHLFYFAWLMQNKCNDKSLLEHLNKIALNKKKEGYELPYEEIKRSSYLTNNEREKTILQDKKTILNRKTISEKDYTHFLGFSECLLLTEWHPNQPLIDKTCDHNDIDELFEFISIRQMYTLLHDVEIKEFRFNKSKLLSLFFLQIKMKILPILFQYALGRLFILLGNGQPLDDTTPAEKQQLYQLFEQARKRKLPMESVFARVLKKAACSPTFEKWSFLQEKILISWCYEQEFLRLLHDDVKRPFFALFEPFTSMIPQKIYGELPHRLTSNQFSGLCISEGKDFNFIMLKNTWFIRELLCAKKKWLIDYSKLDAEDCLDNALQLHSISCWYNFSWNEIKELDHLSKEEGRYKSKLLLLFIDSRASLITDYQEIIDHQIIKPEQTKIYQQFIEECVKDVQDAVLNMIDEEKNELKKENLIIYTWSFLKMDSRSFFIQERIGLWLLDQLELLDNFKAENYLKIIKNWGYFSCHKNNLDCLLKKRKILKQKLLFLTQKDSTIATAEDYKEVHHLIDFLSPNKKKTKQKEENLTKKSTKKLIDQIQTPFDFCFILNKITETLDDEMCVNREVNNIKSLVIFGVETVRALENLNFNNLEKEAIEEINQVILNFFIAFKKLSDQLEKEKTDLHENYSFDFLFNSYLHVTFNITRNLNQQKAKKSLLFLDSAFKVINRLPVENGKWIIKAIHETGAFLNSSGSPLPNKNSPFSREEIFCKNLLNLFANKLINYINQEEIKKIKIEDRNNLFLEILAAWEKDIIKVIDNKYKQIRYACLNNTVNIALDLFSNYDAASESIEKKALFLLFGYLASPLDHVFEENLNKQNLHIKKLGDLLSFLYKNEARGRLILFRLQNLFKNETEKNNLAPLFLLTKCLVTSNSEKQQQIADLLKTFEPLIAT